jgi:hypothetical protein
MRFPIFIILSAFMLAGCATEFTPSSGGDGYSETQLSLTTFQVTFRGNTKTTPERAYDFALLRGAELALANKCPHFVVISATAGDNGTAGMMINSSFIAKKKPEVSLSVRIYSAKPSGDSLEAAYVRKSIRAKYQMPE